MNPVAIPNSPRRRHRPAWAMLIVCAIGALAICVAAPPKPTTQPGLDVNDPPQGVVMDDWYVVMVRDMEGELNKSGYAQIRIERQGDEMITSSLVQLDFRRGAAAVAMSVEEVSRETVDARPLSFSTDITAARQVVRTQGTIDDGRVSITTKQGDRQLAMQYDYPQGALMAWGLLREALTGDRSPGHKRTVRAYVPSIRPDDAVELTYVFGRKVEAQRVEQSFQFGAAFLDITSWMDETGTVLVQDMPISFLHVRLIKCPEAIAKNPGEPPEIFEATAIELNKPIDRQKANAVTYTLRATGDKVAMPDLPTTGLQTPQRVDERTIRVIVRRQDHEVLAHAQPTPPPTELQTFLQSTIYVDITDPVVKEMADKAARTAQGDSLYALADALRQYVSKAITCKSLNIGYATASEVARSKEGDCSEHAVLLTALARARGLPARAVSGLVGTGEQAGAAVCDKLYYHMWTQVWISGTWVDLDAAQHQTDCDPTHIALSIMPLTSDVVVEEELLRALQVIGQLEVTVEQIE
jgi:hypothetical protein